MSDDKTKDLKGLKSECPICFKQFERESIEVHVDKCIALRTVESTANTPTGPKRKKFKVDCEAWGCLARSLNTSRSPSSQSQTVKATHSPSYDVNKLHTNKSNQSPIMNKTEKTIVPSDKKMTINTISVPLAEQMRPNSLDTYIGHEQIVGKSTVLRKLLDGNEIPSLILWGPPGCGKVKHNFYTVRYHEMCCR